MSSCLLLCVWFIFPVLSNQNSMSYHDFTKNNCPHGYIVDYTQTPFICYYGPQSLLQYLLYPVCINEFIDKYFDRRPLHISRGDGNNQYYASLNIMNSYEELLNNLDTKSDILGQNGIGQYPELFCAKYESGKDQHVKPWRADKNSKYLSRLSQEEINKIKQYHQELNNELGPWDYEAVDFMARNNYTLKFYKLEYHLMSLRNLCDILSNQIGLGVRSNMYLTPAFNKGYNAHYDIEEAWIMQINNTKHWKIYDELYYYCSQHNISFIDKSNLCQTNIISELSTRAYDDIRNIVKDSDILMEFQLKPGDLLYVPRGWMHEADILNHDKFSIHITLGIYLELYSDYLFQFIKYLFSVKQIKMIFKRIFYVRNVAASKSSNIKIIKKHLLNDLEPWLRTVSFKEDELRDSIPYFYHINKELDDNDKEFDDKIIKLFRKYFLIFMQYVNTQRDTLSISMYSDTFHQYITQFMELLKDNKIKLKIKNKILNHYRKTLSSFNGVYRPKNKEIQKKFKRISWPMRLSSIRSQLAYLNWQ